MPLYPKFPLFEVPKTYVAVRLEDILIALVILVWFLAQRRNLGNLLKQNITRAFLVFWAVGLLSLASALFLTYSVIPHLGVLHWLRRVEVMSLFFVAWTTIKNVKQLKIILSSMLAVTIVVCLYGFGQIFLGFPVVSTQNREFSKGLLMKLTPGARVNSTFAGQYDLAAYLSIVLIFTGAFLTPFLNRLTKIQPGELFKPALLLFEGLVSFVLLGFTASRISFAAALLGISLSFWMLGKKLLIVGLILISLTALITIPQLRHRLVATVTVNLLQGGGPKYAPPSPSPETLSDYLKRKQGALDASEAATPSGNLPVDIVSGEPTNYTELEVSRSVSIRLNVEWPRAVMAFTKNPVLGTGYSSLTIATDNDILRSLGETGLLGFLSLALIFIIIGRRLVSALKSAQGFKKLFLVSTLSSMVAMLLTATFIDVLESSKLAIIFWILLGSAFALAPQKDKQQLKSETEPK